MVALESLVYAILFVGVLILIIGLLLVSIFWKMSNYYLNYTEAHEGQLQRLNKRIEFVMAFADEVELAKQLGRRAELGMVSRDIDNMDLAIKPDASPETSETKEPSKGAVAGPGLLKRTVRRARKLIVPETGGGTEPAGGNG